MSDTELTPMPEPGAARRIEIFTGAGRRRTWSAAAKAEIMAEAEREGETVSAVARRHGLTPQQIFTWRREAQRRARTNPRPAMDHGFVPVVSEPVCLAEPGSRQRGSQETPRETAVENIALEVEIGGALIRVRHGAEARTVAAVLEALKPAR